MTPRTRASAAAAAAPAACAALSASPSIRKSHAKRSFNTAKGVVRFVLAEHHKGQVVFPAGFAEKEFFPCVTPSTRVQDRGGVQLFHCGACPKLWHCLEAFAQKQGSQEHNITTGYAGGLFRTRSCYFYRQNGNSLNGYEDSEREDVCFRTIQADAGGLIYLQHS